MWNGSLRPGDRAAQFASGNILGRWLHFGVAICVVLCLALGWLAARADPKAQSLAAAVAFNLHKFIGLNALLLALLFLVWSALGHARAPADLFPWFSPGRLKSIAGELAPPPRDLHVPATAAMVQGLGIVLVLLTTASGLALVLLSLAAEALKHQPTPYRETAAAMHLRASWQDAFATVHLRASVGLAAYLAVHLTAALLHAARGRARHLARMFRLLSPD